MHSGDIRVDVQSAVAMLAPLAAGCVVVGGLVARSHASRAARAGLARLRDVAAAVPAGP